jgi:hypothetical protein
MLQDIKLKLDRVGLRTPREAVKPPKIIDQKSTDGLRWRPYVRLHVAGMLMTEGEIQRKLPSRGTNCSPA